MSLVLTEKMAAERRSIIKDSVKYVNILSLELGQSYNGYMTIQFNAVANTKKLFLDYSGDTILSLFVNGEDWKDKIKQRWRKPFIEILPTEYRTDTENVIQIKYLNKYSTDGYGLCSFTDTDSSQYVYCQNQPFFANSVAPMFDQPDIKAKMNLHLTVNDDWVCISNTALVDKEPNPQEKGPSNKTNKSYQFKETTELSPHLLTFAAGPFKGIVCAEKDLSNPLSLFVRSSLFEHATKQKDLIFPYVVEGLKSLKGYLKSPLPYDKIDLVFVPELAVGSIQGAGLITLDDNLIARTAEVNPINHSRRAQQILQGLASYWFGSSVTMQWWSDMWVNDAISVFLSYQTLDSINLAFDRVKGSALFQTATHRAYEKDALFSARPLYWAVKDSSQALILFDSITWQKGAAVIKQLLARIGVVDFPKALNFYLTEYQSKNATNDQFFDQVRKATGDKSEKWYKIHLFQSQWVEAAGHNMLAAEFSVEKETTKVKVTQTNVSLTFTTLRYHSVKFAGFDKNNKLFVDDFRIVLNNQVTELVLPAALQAVYFNYEDHSFAEVDVSGASREYFLKNVDEIVKANPEIAVIVHRFLFQCVRQEQPVPAIGVLDLFKNTYLSKERSSFLVLDHVLELVRELADLYVPRSKSGDIIEGIVSAFVDGATDKTPKAIIEVWCKHLPWLGRTHKVNLQLKELFENGIPSLRTVELSPQQRWQILFSLLGDSEFSARQIQTFRNYLEKNDKSDQKIYGVKAIGAFGMDDQETANALDALRVKQSSISYRIAQATLKGLNSPYRSESQLKPVLKFLKVYINGVIVDQTVGSARTIFDGVMPFSEDFNDSIKILKNIFDNIDEDSFFVKYIYEQIAILQKRKKAFSV